MTAPTIRLATTDDADALLALWARADAPASTTADGAGVRLAIAGNATLVAELDGHIVGSLIAAFDGWRGNMYRLAVDPDLRRQGVALALVAAGERHLEAQGCRRITALVLEAEEHATDFWRAAGYLHDDRIARFVKTRTS